MDVCLLLPDKGPEAPAPAQAALNSISVPGKPLSHDKMGPVGAGLRAGNVGGYWLGTTSQTFVASYSPVFEDFWLGAVCRRALSGHGGALNLGTLLEEGNMFGYQQAVKTTCVFLLPQAHFCHSSSIVREEQNKTE